LSIEQRHGRPALDHCARCLATVGRIAPLFRSRLPLRLLIGSTDDLAGDAAALAAEAGLPPERPPADHRMGDVGTQRR
jgi:hypothetical protein